MGRLSISYFGDGFPHRNLTFLAFMLPCTIQFGTVNIGAMAFGEAIFGSGAPPQFILLDEVGCSGDENRLVNCSHRGINIHDCLHAEDACVRCPLPPGEKATSYCCLLFIVCCIVCLFVVFSARASSQYPCQPIHS